MELEEQLKRIKSALNRMGDTDQNDDSTFSARMTSMQYGPVVHGYIAQLRRIQCAANTVEDLLKAAFPEYLEEDGA